MIICYADNFLKYFLNLASSQVFEFAWALPWIVSQSLTMQRLVWSDTLTQVNKIYEVETDSLLLGKFRFAPFSPFWRVSIYVVEIPRQHQGFPGSYTCMNDNKGFIMLNPFSSLLLLPVSSILLYTLILIQCIWDISGAAAVDVKQYDIIIFTIEWTLASNVVSILSTRR